MNRWHDDTRAPLRATVSRRVRAAVLGGLAALPACTPSLWTDVAYDSGQPELRRVTLPEAGADKAEVLDVLGPPGEMIAQPDGDIWVYRLRVYDQRIINIDTRHVAPVAVPIYVDVDGDNFDRTVFIFFAEDGTVDRLARTDVR